MENVFDKPILEQMYLFRKEDFEQTTYDNNKEIQEIESEVYNVNEKLIILLKEVISNEEDFKKVKNKLQEYELKFSKEVDFWSKAYYMLGMNDMHKLKNELKAGSKTITKGDTFLDCTDADFYEYIQSKINYNTEIYKEYKSKCRELEEKYPRVLKVYEDSTPIVLNQEEMIKLMEIKELDIKVGYEEAKACFKAGINEILNF